MRQSCAAGWGLFVLTTLVPESLAPASSLSAPLALASLTQSSQASDKKTIPTPGPARRITNDFYFLADVGGAITTDLRVNDLPLTATNTGVTNTTIALDAGLRFDVGLGYEINEWLAFEVETGLIWNGVKNVSGFISVPPVPLPVPVPPVDASLSGGAGGIYEVPIMFNLQARVPLNKDPRRPLSLVIGGGVGAVWSDAQISGIETDSIFGFGSASLRGSAWAFAYQANAGVEWSLARNITLGVRYAFLGTTKVNYGPITAPVPEIRSADITVDAIYTNAIMATLKIDF